MHAFLGCTHTSLLRSPKFAVMNAFMSSGLPSRPFLTICRRALSREVKSHKAMQQACLAKVVHDILGRALERPIHKHLWIWAGPTAVRGPRVAAAAGAAHQRACWIACFSPASLQRRTPGQRHIGWAKQQCNVHRWSGAHLVVVLQHGRQHSMHWDLTGIIFHADQVPRAESTLPASQPP